VQSAISWAATKIAIESHMAGADFSEERQMELHIHVNYLFHGARKMWVETLESENIER
jgi:hypothetical protein